MYTQVTIIFRAQCLFKVTTVRFFRHQLPSSTDTLNAEDAETVNKVHSHGLAVDWIGSNLYWSDRGETWQSNKLKVKFQLHQTCKMCDWWSIIN